MADICLYFQVHQPNRLKPYSFFDIGHDPYYEDDALNRDILRKVSEKCYLPASQLMLDILNAHPEFKVAFSLSGVFIEQAEHHAPEVIRLFRKLQATGRVEFLAETYYHSLCYRHSGAEFVRQVKLHENKLREVFGVSKPRVLRHTELIYFNELAQFAEEMGYDGMLAEGVPAHLRGRHPNGVFTAPGVKQLKTLTRNCALSDDLAFRYGTPSWDEHPLTVEKYAEWISREPGDAVNLFIDFETIGEHKWADTGVFEFWEQLPPALLAAGSRFLHPSEVVDQCDSLGTYDVHAPSSWADSSKDLSAWKGNPMQLEATRKILSLENEVKAHNDPDLLHQWSKMQTSDHFYYMYTKGEADGEVHDYFNPYPSPYEGYVYFMNALSDLQVRLDSKEMAV